LINPGIAKIAQHFLERSNQLAIQINVALPIWPSSPNKFLYCIALDLLALDYVLFHVFSLPEPFLSNYL